MVRYYDLGAEKRLNEIVMAGSHDAGITHGGGNAKTQKVAILGQASAGVRLFDLRVAANAGLTKVEFATYHGALSKGNTTKRVVGLPGQRKVVESNMLAGTWGEGLLGILADAKRFVTDNPSEFLILKFDKCKNWPEIAELCVRELGTHPSDVLYKGAGNVNRKTLFELAGKVVVVFTSAGLTAVPAELRGAGGILGIRNLQGGGAYQRDYNGIQYYGKGGTDLTTREGKSIQENYKKQSRLMEGGIAGNPNVMGMMYWTTTGVIGSIRKRNKQMWNAQHAGEMADLWANGLGDAVKVRVPQSVDPASFAGGQILKRFLPNFVMIDFASPRKCQLIYDLNASVPTQLTKMEQLAIAIRKQG